MMAHATGLALLVLGGKRDEQALSDYLSRNGLGGAITSLCVEYLRGAIGKGPVVTMVDFVKRGAALLQREPKLAQRVETVLQSYDLTIEKIEAYLGAIKNSSQGAFTAALNNSRATAPAAKPEPVQARII